MVKASRGTERPHTLRRLNVPRSVELRLDSSTDAPAALRRNGGWLNVVELLDRYRTDDRWWTERPIARTYYELLLEDGRRATMFRDEITSVWWEQKYQ